MIRRSIIALFLVCLYNSCDSRPIEKEIVENNQPPFSSARYSYLALGDSYTIGEGVRQNESFPYLLQKKLAANAVQVNEPRVIARTGWTCDELMSAINSQVKSGEKYDLVSLLIGVNDQYRQYDIKDYPGKFKALLQKAISLSGNNPQRVVVISIPDYGATPYGSRRAEAIGKEIDAYNAINKTIALELQCGYVDITEISRMAKTDPDLVAPDGLHPSGKMYGQWVEKIFPLAAGILK